MNGQYEFRCKKTPLLPDPEQKQKQTCYWVIDLVTPSGTKRDITDEFFPRREDAEAWARKNPLCPQVQGRMTEIES